MKTRILLSSLVCGVLISGFARAKSAADLNLNTAASREKERIEEPRITALQNRSLPAFQQHQRESGLKKIFVEPKSAFIAGIGESQRLLVTGVYADGSLRDLSRQAGFSVADPDIAVVDQSGQLTSRGHGVTRVRVVISHIQASALVVVRERNNRDENYSFATDVAPIFSRMGCNASGCHGALNGQAGFKLSLFGYDPESDYQAIVKGGRRVNLENPEESLILQKPSFSIPHGGGQVLIKDSMEYLTLREWIAAGAPQGVSEGPHLQKLEVYPQDQRILTSLEQKQQLVVVGRFGDGREVDMTRQVRYIPSDESVVSVSPEGVVSAKRGGEANIMVRSLGAVGVARMAVVLRPPVINAAQWPRVNFIDDLVFEKLARLRMIPSARCTDSEFIRRVFLDVIGTLPAPEEVKAFLANRSPDRREQLIDSLFRRPEYADFWSLKWGDLFTNSPQFLYNATDYFQSWLRDSIRRNIPYDRFAQELITSSGPTYQALPTNFYV